MEINGNKFTIGADPEVFMAIEGKFTCASGVIKGTKSAPHLVHKGAVQVDGMALEFNIDPADSFEAFSENLNTVQEQLLGMLPPGAELMSDASVIFDENFYEAVPHESKVLGCDADYNAYTLGVNPRPNMEALMRTAGGHIHIGGFETYYPHDTAHMSTCARLSRILDETLGTYSLLWDKDDLRRSLYGAAGSFRPKTYGMEYRTLSNAWIFKPHLVKFIYDGVVEALEKMFDTTYEPPSYIQEMINTSQRNHPFLTSLRADQLRAISQ